MTKICPRVLSLKQAFDLLHHVKHKSSEGVEATGLVMLVASHKALAEPVVTGSLEEIRVSRGLYFKVRQSRGG